MCKRPVAERGAGRMEHGAMLVGNRMWLALGKNAPSSFSRAFGDTSIALPKETRPLLGRSGYLTFLEICLFPPESFNFILL